ncbi:voltage-gated potassium channel [Amycolatopsis arida]|uniref:Voltage-gated potassium channel n=1 Tax=Amycolatopsis arida TaxID=587909 RepID=A0A1I5QL62_9PSEU|nr:ion channel [Amycolatopsis arida]TDX98887.1 voltage-gated potassium channel [Amycolatopsis arida]SFP47048.1 voltage-gated potassium channel [Amycolatopsis arida]
MPIFLARLLARLTVLRSWATPVLVIVFVFVTSWPLMALAEPPGSELVEPENYWWYFVVTAATVGYGDFFPETGGGHVVGAYVIVGGIATLTTLFTKLASVLEQAKGRRMQGGITVDASDHVVLLGYTPGRTERIVGELLADGGCRVVLCGWEDVAAHPMPDQPVDFVRGNLTEHDVLRRAAVHRARSVLVDARDDNEALALAVTVDHIVEGAHVVVTLRDMAQATLVGYVNERIRCVQWHTPRMITEELKSPGIAEVYAELMTHGGTNTYSAPLPESVGPVRVGDCQSALGRSHGATLLAARAGGRLLVNPSWDTELPAGAVLYYLSPRRLTPAQITQALD